ncbi:MAG: DUF3299 domain-containing protein [Alphaproteobacteria bacterium]|nr:DUF3299 domain-containing protein [Alphaproteobacteria bacterium]
MTPRRRLLAIALSAPLGLRATIAAAQERRGAAGGPRTLQWRDLVPGGFDIDAIYKRYAEAVAEMGEDDPRAEEKRREVAAAFAQAPVVAELDGSIVRLPGYPVPLDGDVRAMKSFLLVPFYGACIHVPPPPPNQIVHVVADKPVRLPGPITDPVWATGVMRVQPARTELAEAGYTLQLRELKRYRA